MKLLLELMKTLDRMAVTGLSGLVHSITMMVTITMTIGGRKVAG